MERTQNLTKGSFYIFLAACAYSVMGACAKLSYAEANDRQIVFARSFLCLLFLMPWVLFPKPKPLATSCLKIYMVRSIAGLLNMYCFFASIRYILLSDAMLLNNTMPLFIPLVMWVWKREPIPMALIPGLLLGFLGVGVILRPGLEIVNPAALLALASGLFMSVSMAGVQELSRSEPLYRILFYYFAISTGISLLPLFVHWQPLSSTTYLELLGVGFFAAITQFCLTRGYNYASATKVSPVIFTTVILSGAIDWAVWKVKPDLFSWIGALLVIASALLCLRAKGKGAQ